MRALTMLLLLTQILPATAQRQQGAPSAAFQDEFRKAYSAYQLGQMADASTRLERLVSQASANFDVHELLGLVYAAKSQDGKAVQQLRKAVELKPDSLSARNNLATSLMHFQQPTAAETEWRAALAVDPHDLVANRNLARLYVQQGKLEAALPLLEAARQSQPDALDTGYNLALAEEMTGRLAEARVVVEGLLKQKDSGDLHALLGKIDEKQARYVDAVNEFSLAAHLDPSEENLFVWASELMAHRAYEPAITVFDEGTRRYPTSPRLWVGQGMALYARGNYEPAIKALLQAADLNAEDPRAYLFLSKAYLSSPSQADAVIERFRRYAKLRPEDGMAQYYYAVSLWKGRRVNDPNVDYPTVSALLQRSIALNGNNAEVHLQLGVLLNDQHEYGPAQSEFERAVALDPNLADAHFRLGRALLRSGEKDRSQAEFDTFKMLQAQHQASVDKERAEVQQFVIATHSAAALQPNSDPNNGNRP